MVAKPQHANYGIDPPIGLIALVAAALAFFGLGWLADSFLSTNHPVLAWALIGYALITGLSYLVPAAMIVVSNRWGRKRLAGEVTSSLSLSGDENVLDAGCGRGLYLIEMAKNLPLGRATGIDAWCQTNQSETTPEMTHQNAASEGVADRVTIMEGDIRQLSFDDDSFAVVVTASVLHQIPKRQDRLQALAELMRVCKKGGELVVIDSRHTRDCKKQLESAGWHNVSRSKRKLWVFPPARVIRGKKP